jgi:uncharacterized protein YuzE
MTISYDSEVDALYIGFIETSVTTKHVAEGIAVEHAADGRIAESKFWAPANASVTPKSSSAEKADVHS